MYSTGLKNLDKLLSGLKLGDNVVWQVDSVDNYIDFVKPFVKKALEDKRRLVYIRFSHHKPIIKKEKGITVYELDASVGFESFSMRLNTIIRKEGVGVFYVVDCLSYLLSEWSNDLMIGNFFKITCPYLYELDTIAYFCLLRNHHSFKTIARIRDTTQLLIDVYDYENNYYVHPLKVWKRYSSTMFLPHVKKGGRFIPITNSADASHLFSNTFMKGAKSISRNLDYWDRLFMKAEDLSGKDADPKKKDQMVDLLCRLIIAREEKLTELAKKYLKMRDLLNIKSRMVGTGFIGGKSVGMLIARKILSKEKFPNKKKLFEAHDSFYIGSDVFYTYIVENGWWQDRMRQRTKEAYFEASKGLREKLLNGVFPEEITEQFKEIIEYYGQSPIIVRSSSLLEDSYGNAFAGKYESVLPNQGTPEERYERFLLAVRRIYASTMNEDALAYRLQRGLDQMDEQMALLVQRVSGSYHNKYFFPDMAGVGLSYNTFVWKENMDPKAGMLRLVLGLGTRAVDRVEGDYPRIVALDDPLIKPHAGIEDTQRFSQHKMDTINLNENCFHTVYINDLLKENVDLKLDLTAVKDYKTIERRRARGVDESAWIVTFDKLFTETNFQQTMQKILKSLENVYGYPVDVEFTVNFKEGQDFQINVLQCRPLKTKGLGKRVQIPEVIPKEKMIFESAGNFIGGNISHFISRIIYVDPQAYADLPSQSEKYDIARVVGDLNRQIKNRDRMSVMLLGPGRWGTTTPSLGVPVSFAEIHNMTVLGEIEFATSNAVPDLSFGTHFFQDLIETGIMYLALFPEREDVYMNKKFFQSTPNLLATVCPDHQKYSHVVKVIEVGEKKLNISSDIITQRFVYFSKYLNNIYLSKF